MQGADLTTTVTSSPSTLGVGQDATFTITVRNNGPGNAYGATLSDPVPAGSSLVAAAPSQGTCDATVSCSLGLIPPGAKAVVALTLQAGQAGTLTDTATATSDEPDPTPADATGSGSVSVTAGAQADVGISIRDSPDPASVGGTITYAIKVTNSGPATATELLITDRVPTGTKFSSVKPGRKCSLSSGVVTCSFGKLAAGSYVSVSLNVIVQTSGSITDTASATSTSRDPNASNDRASVTTTVV